MCLFVWCLFVCTRAGNAWDFCRRFCLFICDFVVQAHAVLALQHGEFVRVDDAWDREVISATVLGTSPPKRVPRTASAAGRAAAGRANAGTGIATSASTRAGGGEPRFASPAQSRPPVAPDCREYVLRSKCARNALPSALVRVVGRWICETACVPCVVPFVSTRQGNSVVHRMYVSLGRSAFTISTSISESEV